MKIFEQFKNKNINELTLPRLSKAVIRRLKDLPSWVAWSLPMEKTLQNRKKLLKFKDIHKGKRCFIVANGPSLKKTDLSLLNDEITIGMNRIYLMKDVNGFQPNYLVVADMEVQLKQFPEEYNEVNLTRFYNWNLRRLFTESENLIFFKESFNPDFRPDFLGRIGTGKSVTFACIQLAFFMGFSEVILIGKDHHYKISGTPHISVNANGNEENHFIKGYYKKGMKWDIPNHIGEEYSYLKARKAFEKAGRKILDATIEGHLQVFEKVDYYSLFKKVK